MPNNNAHKHAPKLVKPAKAYEIVREDMVFKLVKYGTVIAEREGDLVTFEKLSAVPAAVLRDFIDGA